MGELAIHSPGDQAGNEETGNRGRGEEGGGQCLRDFSTNLRLSSVSIIAANCESARIVAVKFTPETRLRRGATSCCALPARFCRIPLATDKFILHSRRRRDRQSFWIADQPLAFSRFFPFVALSARARARATCLLDPPPPRPLKNLLIFSLDIPYFSLHHLDVLALGEPILRAYSMTIDRHAHRSSIPAILRESSSFKQTFTHSLFLSLDLSTLISRFFDSRRHSFPRESEIHNTWSFLQRDPPHRRTRVGLVDFLFLLLLLLFLSAFTLSPCT